MQSSQIIPSKKLYQNIASHISVLNKNIEDERSSRFIVSKDKIKCWEDKIAVLEVAFHCLSGHVPLSHLHSAMQDSSYSHWNDKEWWGGNSQTEIFVNKVIARLTKPDLTLSFLLSYEDPHFNLLLPNYDFQLHFLIHYLHRLTDILSFAGTSKSHYSLFHQNAATLLLRPLLDHVALAEYNAAEKIYSTYPALLSKQGTSCLELTPKRYKYINLTPFQIVLRNAEWIEAGKMAQHLTPAERQKQFNAVFPEGKLISYGCKLEDIKVLLNNLYQAIIIDPLINKHDLSKMDPKTQEVLQALQDAINPENYKDCQIGLVFDVQIYLEALGLYDKNFNAFGTWDRRSFWCVRVEELIASCLPTLHLRAHCSGIGNVVSGNAVNWDKLTGQGCTLADGSSYFNRGANSLPGVDFFVGYGGAACWGDGYSTLGRRVRLFKSFVKQQRELEQTLCSNISTPRHRLA